MGVALTYLSRLTDDFFEWQMRRAALRIERLHILLPRRPA
jgi:hypothetical protein